MLPYPYSVYPGYIREMEGDIGAWMGGGYEAKVAAVRAELGRMLNCSPADLVLVGGGALLEQQIFFPGSSIV